MKHTPPAQVPSFKNNFSKIPYLPFGAATKLFSQQQDLPVLGRAEGGDNGNLVMEETPIDWTFRPAGLQGVHGAFAVYITGNSMLPKYRDGDLAYIHPSKQPSKGRYVLVETTEHRGLIKQFQKWEDDCLVVHQFNPDKQLRFQKQTIRQVMLVIGSLDA